MLRKINERTSSRSPDPQRGVKMIRSLLSGAAAAALALLSSTSAHAATFSFATDPFAGSDARSTPGRQVVGGEPFIVFDIAADQFAFERTVFDVSGNVAFGSGAVAGLPVSGLNVIVVGDLDNDANAGTPFGAAIAANLLADRITSDRAGFFIYFNSALDLPRLVYSTNLSDAQADLKILARLTNLAGTPGSLNQFSAVNFQFFDAVPEPASWALMILGFGLLGARMRAASGLIHRPA